MSDTYLTLCDSCAEKMEEAYSLTKTPKSSRPSGCCTYCGKIGSVTQYRTVTVAEFAANRARARRQQATPAEYGHRDRRARYREPWREDTA